MHYQEKTQELGVVNQWKVILLFVLNSVNSIIILIISVIGNNNSTFSFVIQDI